MLLNVTFGLLVAGLGCTLMGLKTAVSFNEGTTVRCSSSCTFLVLYMGYRSRATSCCRVQVVHRARHNHRAVVEPSKDSAVLRPVPF